LRFTHTQKVQHYLKIKTKKEEKASAEITLPKGAFSYHSK